ncbi:MAG TPA: 5-(carboxyamino)imidazole ribonucleotide mutase [Nitrospiria bacterium]
MAKPQVTILMGSQSDLPLMEAATGVLEAFGVPYEITIASAHRSPDWTKRVIRGAEKKGVQVFIAGAGWAAHLAGTVAAHTAKPVIGVPIESSPLNGLDALLSTAMMPSGVPVATMSLGKGGAKNAGLLAVQILATSRKDLSQKLKQQKEQMAREVEANGKRVQRQGS